MAKFLLVLTIVLALAAAGLGWVTKGKIEDLRTTLKQTQTTLANTKSELVKTQQTLADTQTKLSQTQDQLNAANATIATQKDTIAADATTLAAKQADLDAADAKLKAVNDELEKLRDSMPKTNDGGPATISDEIKALQAQIAELTTVNASLQKEKAASDKKVADMVAAENERQKKLHQPGVEGIVMAVNPGYGFVVVSVGDKQGAVPNAELLIKRDGVLIARLRITTVEPVLSVADIIPDSLAKGQRVLPGDKVIFTGNLAQ